jgi:hypothetical protein
MAQVKTKECLGCNHGLIETYELIWCPMCRGTGYMPYLNPATHRYDLCHNTSEHVMGTTKVKQKKIIIHDVCHGTGKIPC